MSIINDMLKDLEARKASSGQPSIEDMLQSRRQGEALPGHVDGLRHIDVTPPIEQAVRRRLPWLFWPFMLALLAIAAALFLLIRAPNPDGLPAWMPEGRENRTSSGDLPPLPVPSSVEGLARTGGEASPPVPKAGQVAESIPGFSPSGVAVRPNAAGPSPWTLAASMPQAPSGFGPREPDGVVPSPAPAPETAPPATPQPAPEGAEEGARLVMLSAVDQGQALRLDLAFDAALRETVRLTRDGERVELYLPGILSATAERPHPGLREWHSQPSGEGWRLGFAWPSAADVRLQPRRSGDGLQHWELTLASHPSSVPPEAALREGARRLPASDPSTGSGPAPANNAIGSRNVTQTGETAAPAPPKDTAGKAPPPRPLASPRTVAALTPPQQAEALYAEAWQLQQKGRAELAMDKLRQAVQAQPEHARARELLVRLLMRAGQPRAAELELVRGLDLQPRQPELVELMARMLADQGRGQEALGLLHERMQADRLAHQALFAVLAARAGEPARAAEAYRHAAELDPRDPRWPLGRAIALENSGQPGAARAAYAQALGLEGLDAASRAFIQERLQHLGQGD